MFATIGRSPSGGFKTRCVQNLRVARVYGYIIDVTVAIQNLLPGFARVFGKKYPAAVSMITLGERPRRQIQALGVVWIYGESIRSVRSRGHRNNGPVFGSVRGTIECSIAIRADTSIFRAARNQEIKHTVAVARNPPRKRLFLRDAGIFQFPTPTTVSALVHTAT